MSFFDGERPRVFGHRGAAGLAPENTLPSFALAVALGADYLELDVHATLDGAIVVFHDPDLERTTDGEGPVLEHTLAQLHELDAGYRFTLDGTTFPYRGQGVRVPTLESLLTAYPGICFNIEIKPERLAFVERTVERVVEILERTDSADRVLLAAEHHSIMLPIRGAIDDRIATGMSAEEVVEFVDRLGRDDWSDYRPQGRALQVPPSFQGIDLVTERTLAAAHRLGLEVHVWTVNDAEQIGRLLDLGVDGIMSDLPGLVRAAVAARVSSR